MNDPITETQLRAVLDEYIAPMYQIAGAALAALALFLVFYLIVWPFIKRSGR